MTMSEWKDGDTMTSVVRRSAVHHAESGACIVHVSENNSSTRTRVLDRGELTIGRDPECSLVIACSHVSRIHVRLRKGRQGWSIYDNDSVNGILVNGIKRQFSVLQFGDRIDLGRGEFLLYRPYDPDYQRAQEAQKLESLGRLASGIAHDFNNVLMAIVGAATCLQEDLDAGDKSSVDDTIADIMTASERGASLAKQLLGFSRQGENPNEIVEISGLVEEVIRLVERTFDQGITIRTNKLSDATVVANHSKLTQVFMNLCINARDAMPHGGEITVDVLNASPVQNHRIGSFVCVKVTDTGVGMSHEVRERIFEPFFSTKGEGRGTGLGMATSYGIVTSLGGLIEIDSKEGAGTCVSVYLPAQEQPKESTPVRADTKVICPQGNGRIILLAEDQTLVRRHTARILRRLGYKVLEACDGMEAVEIVSTASETIAMAMLDLQMPRRSGDEACRMIRALDPDLPVVMVSGNIADPRIERLVEDDDIGVLSKPFGSNELAQILCLARGGEPSEIELLVD